MKTLEQTFNKVDNIAVTLWRYGWGLLFVVAMTVLSELTPGLSGYSQPSATATPTSAMATAASYPGAGSASQLKETNRHDEWHQDRF